MKKLLLFFCFTMAAYFPSIAQDQHFTQFYSAPLTINPALTGSIDAKYRMGLIYRDQWRNVLDNPATTIAGALDLRFPIVWRGAKLRDAAGVGLMFFNDKNPGTDFTTTQIALSGAYHKSLNKVSNQFLSLGVQIALSQRNVNYENLTFEDQFNGTTGFTVGTAESLPPNNFSYADYAVGLNYSYAPVNKTGFFAGFAIHHFLEPQMSFYFDEVNPEESPSNTLFTKYSGQLNVQIPLGKKFELSPRTFFAKQGPHLELNAGTNFRILISDLNNTALHIGSWVRTVGNEDDSFGMDAVIIMFGFEVGDFLVGASYDASVNDLRVTSTGLSRSALEFSLVYLGEYENEEIQCPKF